MCGVRMDGVERVGPYLLLGGAARHPLDRRAYVADGAVGFEDGDGIGGVLYQRAESLLALFDGFIGLLALGDIANDGQHQAPSGFSQALDQLYGA